jgi:hypothetical protein
MPLPSGKLLVYSCKHTIEMGTNVGSSLSVGYLAIEARTFVVPSFRRLVALFLAQKFSRAITRTQRKLLQSRENGVRNVCTI